MNAGLESLRNQEPEIVFPPATFSASQIRELAPLERIAFKLAISLFSTIVAVTAAVVIDWLVHRPSAPNLAQLKIEDQKSAIEAFKSVSDVMWERTSKAFDLVVMKALLPVFATVVGYLLGKRGN